MTSVATDAAEAAADALAVRPMRKDAARNRELLICAAREVFATRGREASLDEIAHHAGLGVGTAYRHFRNKHELIAAIADQQFEQVVEYAERALLADDPWEGIVGYFEAVLALQVGNRGLREVLIDASDGSDSSEASNQLLASMRSMLLRAQRAGVVRADAEPSDLGFVVMMLCTVTDVAGDAVPDLWRRYLPMVLDGLRPGGSAFGAPALDVEEMSTAVSERMQKMRAAHRASD